MLSTHTMAVLIRANLPTLLSEWRTKAHRLPAAEKLDTPTLNNHIPVLLEELATALEAGTGEQIAEQIA